MVEEGKGWRESAAKEEDLQLGGFIHRVSGHHSEKDWGLPQRVTAEFSPNVPGSALALVAGDAVGLLFAGKSNMA